jgi:hypothetical protein
MSQCDWRGSRKDDGNIKRLVEEKEARFLGLMGVTNALE